MQNACFVMTIAHLKERETYTYSPNPLVFSSRDRQSVLDRGGVKDILANMIERQSATRSFGAHDKAG